MPNWKIDFSDIAERISNRQGDFKIVLKIKDDVFFIRRWIEHHRQIVGLKNLIIFDNMSVLPEIEAVYQDYGPSLLVVRFDGFHNNLHRVHEFPQLYKALRASTKYYQFLDSDEYLICIDDKLKIVDASEIVPHLLATGSAVNPGSWLENVQGYDYKFWWDLRQNHPAIGLRSGKPIISSDVEVKGLINHNWQVGISHYDKRVSTNFFVLHLKRLSPAQRIETNIRKLHAYNAFKGSTLNLGDILQLDILKFPAGNKQNWVKEIHNLSNIINQPSEPESKSALGKIDIVDNFLIFSSESQKKEFDRYIQEPWLQVFNSIGDRAT
ncbi:hypothetical protein [Sphingomonas sp. Leaf38]|uniref:hypothetical protein n=1 Tax=Sphingomonas sp. Leaf38 TaxID=1736217 RepID=UPI0012E1D060|nr:hypothetical protein [Sphingomonas sp. Leaf38]